MSAVPISIPELTLGERVQDTFLVWDVERRAQADGSPYAILHLANATGRVPTAPFWATELTQVEGLARGAVVSVIGEVQDYRGGRQLKVSSLRPVPQALADLGRFLPSVGDVERYWRPLDKWRGEMAAGPWKRAVNSCYEDPDFRRAYERCPASTGHHHAQLGGLLKHTVEVAYIALAIARTCGADWDTLIAGVLLHDIGKLEAYRYDGIFETTDRGALLGHVALGALLLDERLAALAPPLARCERDLLLHLVLSHHGQLEYGSPVRPMTLEAEILHQADTASARAASMADALRDPSNFQGGSALSRPLWQLDQRRAWRGNAEA